MGQLKVRFTIEHYPERSVFIDLCELKQHPHSQLLMERMSGIEAQLKLSAAKYWLQQRLVSGRDDRFTVELIKESGSLDGSHSKEADS